MSQFLSDNAAAVHPKVWEAMHAADQADKPYDGDALSAELDARFSDLFGRECVALWVATGTAANCLALATMVQPHGGVVCHEEAHVEMDEGGAPGFFLHGAKLMLTGGESAKHRKITPASFPRAKSTMAKASVASEISTRIGAGKDSIRPASVIRYIVVWLQSSQ